jgi:hypothetical protein
MPTAIASSRGFPPSAMLLSFIDPGGDPDDIGKPIGDLDIYPVIELMEPAPGIEPKRL